MVCQIVGTRVPAVIGGSCAVTPYLRSNRKNGKGFFYRSEYEQMNLWIFLGGKGTAEQH
jgi:hypothetical protein